MKEAKYILLIVYVDDLLYIGSTDDITTWFEGELQQDLSLTASSTVTQYLGLNILDGESTIYLSAAKYADTITKRFGLSPAAISMPYRYTAGNHQEKSNPLGPAGLRDYQWKLGCLLFASVTCRPDLSYSASLLATYLKRPQAEHMAELDRALHYLVSTPTIGLTYHKTGTTTPKLIGYVDTHHAGDFDNRRSRTGYIYRLVPVGPISWQSSKQELIALCSAEVEYIALCSATKEGLYLRELLEEANLAQLPSLSLFCDNQYAILIANKSGFANRTKHIALRYFFVKDEIEKWRLKLSYCHTSKMAADYNRSPISYPAALPYLSRRPAGCCAALCSPSHRPLQPTRRLLQPARCPAGRRAAFSSPRAAPLQPALRPLELARRPFAARLPPLAARSPPLAARAPPSGSPPAAILQPARRPLQPARRPLHPCAALLLPALLCVALLAGALLRTSLLLVPPGCCPPCCTQPC
ncbi:unnamed protein product [Closterium sp. NIES-54]